MSSILELIKQRQSARATFDPQRPVGNDDLAEIVEAARWAPTAHNMQNFEILIVDDPVVLKKIGQIKGSLSADFLRENYRQTSFSEKEFLQKKVGALCTDFPPDWLDMAKVDDVVRRGPSSLEFLIRGSPTLLIVTWDPRQRAPNPGGHLTTPCDDLSMMSLGCVMENMWLMAQSLGIGFTIMIFFSEKQIESDLRQALGIPEHLKIAFAARLGYPVTNSRYIRVRRDQETFIHHNQYGNRGLDRSPITRS